ncbi:MAG: O-antigen ligase family protein [Gammaproteobacteria bacterium]|nr:O-antigen ligase family protein [Gammaproteobacteria bacterium]
MYLLEYRVPISAALLVFSFASVFVLTSQTGSSIPTYLLAILTLAACRRWAGLWLDWTFLCAVALIGYLAASSFWSDGFDARDTFSRWARALVLVSFVVAAAEGFRTDWFFRRLTLAIALFAGAAAAVALVRFFVFPPDDGRLGGLGQLECQVCAALIFGVALLCTLYWVFEAPSLRWRALAALNALCLLSAVVLTDSRNAWVAVPFAGIVYLVSRRSKSATAFAVIVIAIAAVSLAMVGGLLASPASEFLLPRGDSFRPAIWGEILSRALVGSPWLGNGVLTGDDVLIGCYLMVHPHNMYLAVLFQGGLVAVALFAAVLALSIRTLLLNFPREEAKLALGIYALALPAYLLDGHELLTRIGWTWLLVWLPVAISVALSGGGRLDDANRFGGG